MSKESIQPVGLTTPSVYSHVVKVGNMLYLSGQVAEDENGDIVGLGDINAQAEQVFQNVGKCLTAAGATFADMVKVTVYVTDARYRPALVEVRKKYFQAPFPASVFLVVAGLAAPELLVEVEVTALLPE